MINLFGLLAVTGISVLVISGVITIVSSMLVNYEL